MDVEPDSSRTAAAGAGPSAGEAGADAPLPLGLLLAAVAIAPAATIAVDPATDGIEAANPAADAFLKAQALAGTRLTQWLNGEPGEFIVFVDALHHYGEGWTRSVPFRDADGAPADCELRGRHVRTCRGPRLVLTMIDLEEIERRDAQHDESRLHRAGLFEWRRAQAFFAELERENRLILDAAGEGIYGVNTEGKATFVNRAAQEMLGWTTEDLLGRNIHAVIHHHHANGDPYPARECPIYRSFRSERTNRIENEVFWRKDGRPIQVEYVSTPIYDQKVLAGAVVIFRDITQRKESERHLHEAIEEIGVLRDRLEQENAYLQEEISSERAHHEIVGRSPAIRNLRTQIDLVARTDANVLVSGESGTGKALVAAAIHKAGARRRRPLIRLDCAAIGASGFDAELFGPTPGENRDGRTEKPGKLALAHGGTLLLDEVSEVPLECQGRLLAALRDRTDARLDGTRPGTVDTRIVATTTRDLRREVERGRFREDLYFFLEVVPIACAPLRARKEDVPLLATHFLKLACRRLYQNEPVLTKGTVEQMQAYRWPGNVRELENVVERGVILARGGKLTVDLGATAERASGKGAGILTEHELQRLEADNLMACLREANGKVSGSDGAAALLGVKPTTFRSRLKARGISYAELARD